MRESELILRDDGSIYHLALHPGDLATTIVTVGDQGRVPEVSKHFDKIEVIKSSREFLTHTGYIGNKRISCVSTGMGSDNIDIFMNEVDALFNIDFDEKKVKEKPTSLTFIRIGTSGSIHPKIALGDLLVTEVAIGLEGLMLFYELGHPSQMEKAWLDELKTVHLPVRPEVFVGSDVLRNKLCSSTNFIPGVTMTAGGFYAPQNRNLRASRKEGPWWDDLMRCSVHGMNITNIEMETAALYGMAKILGHQAVSVNSILAHRLEGSFASHPQKLVNEAIAKTLEVIL